MRCRGCLWPSSQAAALAAWACRPARAPAARSPAEAPPFCPALPQAARRAELLAAGKAGKEEKLAAARKAKAAARPAVKKVSKAFYNTMITDSGEEGSPVPPPCFVCSSSCGVFFESTLPSPRPSASLLISDRRDRRLCCAWAGRDPGLAAPAQLPQSPPLLVRCRAPPTQDAGRPTPRPTLTPPPPPPTPLPPLQTTWARTTRCSAPGWAPPSEPAAPRSGPRAAPPGIRPGGGARGQRPADHTTEGLQPDGARGGAPGRRRRPRKGAAGRGARALCPRPPASFGAQRRGPPGGSLGAPQACTVRLSQEVCNTTLARYLKHHFDRGGEEEARKALAGTARQPTGSA